jgi:hypothetical protein
MAMNPDVTVRARGVMEKCTYCVQRIARRRFAATRSGIPIRDGDVRTACEQACPTRAITFGSIADPSSRVSSLARDPRVRGASRARDGAAHALSRAHHQPEPGPSRHVTGLLPPSRTRSGTRRTRVLLGNPTDGALTMSSWTDLVSRGAHFPRCSP